MPSHSQSQDAVEETLVELAGVVGNDVIRVAPPQERHFDPISVAVAFGGLLLIAYLRGFTREAEGDAEELGQKTARWLRGRIADLFARDANAHRVTTTTEEVRVELERAVANGPQSHEDRARAFEASSKMLEDILASADWNFPRARAAQLTEQVSRPGRLLVESR